MTTVYVGLSGGVDSSVAAALLQRQGYSVVGVYMKNWTQDLPGVKCPWKEDLADARAVAARLDIPFKTYDFQSEYRHKVVKYMIDEYKRGQTPNPDIMCNQEIKFKLFLEAALADGADLIATGHYASVQNGQLYRGKDEDKDQTYFLYRVGKLALGRTIMPIGGYTKPEVRKMAEKLGLPTAKKKDSQGICFVGPVGMKAFLKQYVKTQPGNIKDGDGNILGQHEGAIFYTIGQRQGLGLGGGPWYVTGKDMGTNEVYVTRDAEDLELNSDIVNLESLHLTSDTKITKVDVRFRHRGELYKADLDGDKLRLAKPAHALAVGQSAVFYDGKKVLGGGIIAATSRVGSL